MTQGVLYNIVEDLCTFILKEVIPCKGKYHDATSVLVRPHYTVVMEISRLNLSRDDYTFNFIFVSTIFDVYKCMI